MTFYLQALMVKLILYLSYENSSALEVIVVFFGSLPGRTMNGIPVKIVFILNRNKRSECLYLLSTDRSLSDTEIVRMHGNRWSIECFFKASKSFMKL